MDKQKQIEEMAKVIDLACGVEAFKLKGLHRFPTNEDVATALYNAGYRNQSEIRAEILNEVYESKNTQRD